MSESYDCQGKHLQVGNKCMKCGAQIIDFGDYNEGDGIYTGWKRMKGKIGAKWPVGDDDDKISKYK